MPKSLSPTPKAYKKPESIDSILKSLGFYSVNKISNTLQGSIYRGYIESKSVVIKVANQYLQEKGLAIHKNEVIKVQEDIFHEAGILKYLSDDDKCPRSIVKYHQFYKSSTDYYLIMEDGGLCLFDFVKKAHKLIAKGLVTISHWMEVVKKIFTQMCEAIEYIHSKNVCHFDISLENFLCNDVEINVTRTTASNVTNVEFVIDDIQIKLCDFGLAEYFATNIYKSNKWCGKTGYKSPEVVKKYELFDAKKNDIWCLGVSLFMLLTSCSPWKKAHESDPCYLLMTSGYMSNILKAWNMSEYVNHDVMDLLLSIFQSESNRYSIDEIQSHPWIAAMNTNNAINTNN